MTTKNVAKQPNEDRGKIGPWDVAELSELASAFRELGGVVEQLITLGELHEATGNAYSSLVGERVNDVRRALLELTKGLCGTVVAGAPELGAELARSFFVICGSTGASVPSDVRPPAFEPLSVSVLSTETRRNEKGHVVDVALLRVAFYDPEIAEPVMSDALLIRRDRSSDERRVRHFPTEPGEQHFDRAVECRAQWLGVSDGPFAGQRPCS